MITIAVILVIVVLALHPHSLATRVAGLTTPSPLPSKFDTATPATNTAANDAGASLMLPLLLPLVYSLSISFHPHTITTTSFAPLVLLLVATRV